MLTIIVTGDVDKAATRALVEKHWGQWKRGSYKAAIPQEAAQDGARTGHIDWPTPTLPWVIAGFRGPAYSDTDKDLAALDLLSFLGFDESAPLYRKLVLDEQKVDMLNGSIADHIDPYLFTVYARVKKGAFEARFTRHAQTSLGPLLVSAEPPTVRVGDVTAELPLRDVTNQ